MQAIRLVVGLGNPGSQYTHTRHNAGVWFLDALEARFNTGRTFEVKFRGELARVQAASQDFRIVMPTTFMNLSGECVKKLSDFYDITPPEVLVVHDDVDLPAGTARLKVGGGHGGHNGLRNIIDQLHSKDFNRLRLGIGHPGSQEQVLNYVLGVPSKTDQDTIEAAIEESLTHFDTIMAGQLDKAMNELKET
jgi:PTH1 family peptidyl-tRNA hydrolase